MRILLVEDNVDHRELMSLALTGHDSTWEVETVGSGEEALRLLLGGAVFDLVFLDYSLPGRDGLEVLEEIRRGEAPPPVVMVTGLGNERVAVKAMRDGAYDYVVKGEDYLQRLPVAARHALEARQLAVERKLAEEALRKSESLLKEAQHLAHIGHWELDCMDGTVTWSEGIFRIFGLDPLEGVPPLEIRWGIVHPDDRNIVQNVIAGALKEGTSFDIEFHALHSDGTIHWINSKGHAHKDAKGYVSRIFGTEQDITERKGAEDELITSHQQLRALAARLQEVREEARIMIAREIHDELGGGLAGLKMELASMLRKVYDTEARKERTALMSKVHALNELIDQMIQAVRRIATELRPSVLDDLGLVAALEWHLQEFTSRTEIPHEFAAVFDYVNLEEDTATAVFRIFQEALANVARHSGATKVTVVLREDDGTLFEDGRLVLEIRDNGRGITEGEILDTRSLGILGMRERSLVFGGELRISGEPDSGTTVILKIPQRQGEPS